MNVLALFGTDQGFQHTSESIRELLSSAEGLEVSAHEGLEALTEAALSEADAAVFSIGFARVERTNGARRWVPSLSAAQEERLFRFVREGGGLVAIHGAAWNIAGRYYDLLGGGANWHPPGLTFTVNVAESDHPAAAGAGDFEVEDEIYMCACDPAVETLATARWQNRDHPLAWAKTYGQGRVFYTALGHGPSTFERPEMRAMLTQAVRWAGGA